MRRKIVLVSPKCCLTLLYAHLHPYKRSGFLCRTRKKSSQACYRPDEKFVTEAKAKMGADADAILAKVIAQKEKHRDNAAKGESIRTFWDAYIYMYVCSYVDVSD